MRLLWLFGTFLVCFGCSPNLQSENAPDKRTMINEVRKKAAIKLRNDKKLYAIGTGAQAMDQIKMLALSFTYHNELTIEEGRKLLIYAVSEFVNCINEEEKIRPFLADVPFTPKNVEIRIFLKKPDGSDLEYDKLHVISSVDGVFEYEVWDEASGRLVSVYEETFAEGLDKITLGKKEAL